jgi:beta-glucuronidase
MRLHNYLKTTLLLFLFSSMFVSAQAQSLPIQNIENRKITTLNGKWQYILDQYETGYYNYRYEPIDQDRNPENNKGAFFNDYHATDKSELVEYDFDKSSSLIVPRSWNVQDDKLFYYEGTIWYRKKFDYVKSDATNRLFLYFGAVNYEADVYLNGKKLGKHIGGFTPFSYEITNIVKEKGNSLVVKVDNKRKREGVPTLNTDWFNYGGITRDVFVAEMPSTFVREYFIQLKKGSLQEISGYVKVEGENRQMPVNVIIPELKINQKVLPDPEGFAEINFKLPKATLWSPDNPKLYDVQLLVNGNILKDRIGFRSIETKGSDILLNGKPIFLRGISCHEENGVRGDRAYSKEDAAMLLGRAKELNCNFMRLAHYPHNENMIRMAEEMGILVWEEIPVYWTILWDNKETYANALNQLNEIIARDRNRANVIIWSMANETPVNEKRNEFLTNLIDYTHKTDNTRLVSAALEKEAMPNNSLELTINDPISKNVDVLAFNEYVGWYDGLPDKCTRVNWIINLNKPLIISEFGGGALQGLHGDKSERWTEEFQEDLYIKNIEMLSKISSLRGMTPWILNDFRSPKRMLPGIQDGWNRKGLFSETGDKKKAFYILKSFYDQKEKEYKE